MDVPIPEVFAILGIMAIGKAYPITSALVAIYLAFIGEMWWSVVLAGSAGLGGIQKLGFPDKNKNNQ